MTVRVRAARAVTQPPLRDCFGDLIRFFPCILLLLRE